MIPTFAATAAGPGWDGLAWALLPVLACMAVLAARRLGQVRPLAVALTRLVVQLTLLGVVLDRVFRARDPWVSLAVATVMLAFSAETVGARQRQGWILRAQAFVSLGLGAVIVMAVAIRLSLRVEPWYEPKALLPVLGMVLGNSVNGVALGADRLESELRGDRDRVELRLALGASSRQAATPALRAAVRAALTPTINSMMIAGIVAVPGMMTGQILAGADVYDALRYQILLYFLIEGTVGISTLTLLALRFRRYFTPAWQLRGDLLAEPPRV
ncbi:MAG TPA: iron export ABC transporter permease subunit FetB [Isosphaeraceae bacterium]|jgi:putative ABC transport system permease protein|nr:iron export ABC transporter permease subunit FetB [Isosphaeraceae bacterium]